MSDDSQGGLSLLALGIRGDLPVDPDQPPLVDGNHLRWMPDQELGFPWHGFYLFRRESQPSKPRCLQAELRGVHLGTSASVQLATKLGRLSSPKPLVFSDAFAPAGTVEAQLDASLRFDLPEGVEARRVEVQIGFRAAGPTTSCVDFRPRPVGAIANPYVEGGAKLTFAPSSGAPLPLSSLIVQLPGGPPGLRGAILAQGSIRLEIQLPRPVTTVRLLLTNPSAIKVNALDAKGTSVAAQSFGAMALQAGLVVLSAKAIARIAVESETAASAVVHELCWDVPPVVLKPPPRPVDVNFDNWPLGPRVNPFVEKGVRFELRDERGQPPPLVSFEKRVQLWAGLLARSQVEIRLPCTTTKATLQFSRGSNDPPVRIQVFSGDGTLAQTLVMNVGRFGAEAVSVEGAAIARILIEAPGPDALLHRIFFECSAPAPAQIEVRALAGASVVARSLVRGAPGEVVAAPMQGDRITAIEIAAGKAALVDLCYAPSRQPVHLGWEPLPRFRYPLCLPVADADYPCLSKPSSQSDALKLAHSRVTYRSPPGWDQDFAGLHDELVALVHGGPSAGPMRDRRHATLSGQPLSASTQANVPTLPALRPLDLVNLASLQPAMAQMLGLYFVDQAALPGVAYDYLLLGDTTGALGGSAESALAWLALKLDPAEVWAALVPNQETSVRPPVPGPSAPRAYALPGMAVRKIDGGLPTNAAGSVGLWWPVPPDPIDDEPEPDRIVFYYPKRADFGMSEPMAQPVATSYQRLPTLPPVLVSEADPAAPPAPTGSRNSEWPPPSVPLHVVDGNLPEGWYSYCLSGQTLFGRRTLPSAAGEWYQWDPSPGRAPPWYYKSPAGHRPIHAFGVALLDKLPPPAPLGVDAWALDPLDRWLHVDAAYTKWRESVSPDLVGLRVHWRWTLMQQIQAPDTKEFRVYYQPGRWNALLGTIAKVTAASSTQSDVELDFEDPRPVDAFAGARLRVGNDNFAVVGSQPGIKLRIRVQNIGARDEVGPLVGKRCTVAIPEKHGLWVDTSNATTWEKRIATVFFDQQVRAVVDPNIDANGIKLSSSAFAAAGLSAQVTVASVTAQLPLAAALSGVQPWLDHLWLQDATKASQTLRIVGYDAAARSVILEFAPTIGAPVAWVLGRPALEYEVFVPAPDVAPGQPFEPSLAEPSVYAQIAVTAADDKSHVTDAPKWNADKLGNRFGNESVTTPSATIYRVLHKAPPAPELPELPERLVATKADYHGRSYTTFRFKPVDHLCIHILRALDDSLFQRDWLIRETRKALDPVPPPPPPDPLLPVPKTEHLAFFPDGWDFTRRKAAADALNALATGAAYSGLTNDGWAVLSLLPGNEAQPDRKALEQRDLEMRRLRGKLGTADADFSPPGWTATTRLDAAKALNELAAPAGYLALSNCALRLLAALPGNEDAFTQVTPQQLEMEDPEIVDQRRPDDKADYTPDKAKIRAYTDTLPGRATNRYFYRALFVDGAQNQSALSLPGPPVYLPKVEPPRTPVITGIVARQLAITLRWAANREPDLALYTVYRTGDETLAVDVRQMQRVATIAPADMAAGKQPEWTDRVGLVGGQKLFYRLSAMDASGNESAAGRVAVAVVIDTAVPPAPTWTEQTWLLQRESDQDLLAWPPDGVVAPGHQVVLRLEWQSATSQARFVVERQLRGERGWTEPATVVSAKTGEPDAFVLVDADADPTSDSRYRLLVRSASGVWSTEDATVGVVPPVPPVSFVSGEGE